MRFQKHEAYFEFRKEKNPYTARFKKKKNTEKQGNIGCLNVETLIVAYELYQSSFCKVFPLSVTNISG